MLLAAVVDEAAGNTYNVVADIDLRVRDRLRSRRRVPDA